MNWSKVVKDVYLVEITPTTTLQVLFSLQPCLPCFEVTIHYTEATDRTPQENIIDHSPSTGKLK